MRAEDFAYMLSLQYELNSLVHPHWTSQGFNWRRAILVESAELLDHLGWKWWKYQGANMPQARIELVDIWHFLLSQVLESTNGVEAAAQWIEHQWNKPALCPVGDPRPLVEEFVGAVLTQARPQITQFRVLCAALGLSPQELQQTYIAKNVLNIFRQRNGYKDGTYTKEWNGREDNEVLADLMVAERNPYALLDQLSKTYAHTGSR